MTHVWYEPAADRTANTALLNALEHFCQCEFNAAGARIAACPGHASLAESDSWLKHLLFGRFLAPRLVYGEFTVAGA